MADRKNKRSNLGVGVGSAANSTDSAYYHDNADGTFDEAVGGHMYYWTGSAWAKITAAIFGSGGPATTIYNGHKTVTTAGTQVALGSSQAIVSVVVKALAANTGIIYVGDLNVDSATGFALAAGEAVSFDIANVATVWIDSSIDAQSVTWLAVN